MLLCGCLLKNVWPIVPILFNLAFCFEMMLYYIVRVYFILCCQLLCAVACLHLSIQSETSVYNRQQCFNVQRCICKWQVLGRRANRHVLKMDHFHRGVWKVSADLLVGLLIDRQLINWPELNFKGLYRKRISADYHTKIKVASKHILSCCALNLILKLLQCNSYSEFVDLIK